MTKDGGNTWVPVSAIPVSQANNGTYPGIVGIMFDPVIGGVVNGVTQTIFASSYGNGVYESTNGGSTWTQLAGGPSDVDYATVGPNGAYYAVGNGDQNLWRYFNGVWTELIAGNNGQGVESVAINPNNPNEIVAIAASGILNVSYNGGATWSGVDWSVAVTSADIPWEANANQASGGSVYFTVGGAAFSKSTPNELILSTGTGSFDVMIPTTSLTGTITYNDMSTGIENLVANEILVAPGGTPILASWDRPFIQISNLNSYPTTYGPVDSNTIVAGWSVDYASSTPSFLVGLADFWGVEESGYSTNGGATWTKFATYIPGAGSSFIGGTIAASTTKNFIWAPADGNRPYYTLDGGQTWSPITLPGVGSWSNFDWAYYLRTQTVTADRVLANTFYLYDPGTGVFETTNGGQAWTEVHAGAVASSDGYNSEIMSVPGQAGNLFFTAGIQGNGTNPPSFAGFYFSSNQGATWTAVPNVLEVTCFGFGAAAPGQTYPSIYIVGYVNDVFGVWQSTNKGQSWTQIGTQPTGELDQITTISGDPNVFGRVYVGFTGGGYAYLSGAPYVTGVTTNPASGAEVAGKTVTFTVNMSAAVTVSGGKPTLNLNDGGVATYVSGSGTSALTFTYTVSSSDTAVSALAISSTSLNGATVQDTSGNAASLSSAVTTFSNLSVASNAPVTVATYLANHAALDAAGNVMISDTAANVASAIDTLNADTHVSAITLLKSTNLNLDVAQALGDTRALNAITNSSYGITVTDTGANVAANIAALNADTHITSILPQGGAQPLTLDLTQMTSDARAISLLDPFNITVTGVASDLSALTTVEIATFATDGVTTLDATDANLSLNSAQRTELGAAGISTEQPYAAGTDRVITYTASGGFSTILYEGITGGYTSWMVDYGANNRPTTATYSNGVTRAWSYNTDGSWSTTFSNVLGQAYTSYTINYGANNRATNATYNDGMTQTWNYNSDGSQDVVFNGIVDAPFVSRESLFDPAVMRIANSTDINVGAGTLGLTQSGVTVSFRAGGALSVTDGADTFALNPHTTETVSATGYNSEAFGFTAGFGHDSIAGFAAGGSGSDVLSLQLSMFSGLSVAKTAAQNAAILLSDHALAQSGSNVTLTDTNGDVLTLIGVSTAALSQYASSVFQFS